MYEGVFMKICLRVMYHGKNYSGFQRQDNGNAIQNILDNSLTNIHNREVKTIGASRTDAGVHSMDNVVIFETDREYIPEKWADILNYVLPNDIVVKQSYRVKEDFHPLMFDTKKTYSYTIYNDKVSNPLMIDRSWYIRDNLNINLMSEAARLFEGTHDFAAFKNGNKEYKTTYRTIYDSYIEQDGNIITYKVTGNGFMYNMVRIMISTLVDIGRGKLSIDNMLDNMKNPINRAISRTAPAQGLTLCKVDFFGKEIADE